MAEVPWWLDRTGHSRAARRHSCRDHLRPFVQCEILCVARLTPHAIPVGVLTEAALTLRCKGVETVHLPCRIVFNGDLPIGVRLAFYCMAPGKIARCVNAALDCPG